MKLLGLAGVFCVFFLTACSGHNSQSTSQQEAELLQNGYKAMSGGDYVTAERLLSQALAVNDKNPYTLLNMGVVYQETKRYDQARKSYQSVIDMNPSQTAVASNEKGYSGKKLSEIAKVNLSNLPSSTNADSGTGNSNDTDNDGVPNTKDKCSGTPANAVVNSVGCWALNGIFEISKTKIRTNAHDKLDNVVDILGKNPSLRIEIQGHTDNWGHADKNKRLSEKRAQTVVQYLIQQGVAPRRLESAGYGQTRPMTSNKTASGRRQNRRVEFTPVH